MKFTAILLISLVLLFECSDAYCVYNDLPEGAGTFWLRQQPVNAGFNYFSRFARSSLKPGENACCPYTVSDCNKSGKPDEVLKMTIRRTAGKVEHPPFVISFPAGGSIKLGGGPSLVEATIEVYYGDGTPFDFEYKIDHQAGYT